MPNPSQHPRSRGARDDAAAPSRDTAAKARPPAPGQAPGEAWRHAHQRELVRASLIFCPAGEDPRRGRRL